MREISWAGIAANSDGKKLLTKVQELSDRAAVLQRTLK
jgi:hypothetical protein